jgi:glycosyltransferase involved in cell wall biosynthesis
MKEKRNPTSHVIVSQGYPEFIGKYRMHAWVENVNRLLRDDGYEVCVFTCGEKRRSFVKNGVEVIVSKRLGVLKDPFSLDIPTKILLTKRPSIAVIHGLQHLLTLFSLIIYFLRNIPVIIIVHGLYLSNSRFLSFRDRVLKFILHVFRNSYLLIALTSYDKQLLLEKWRIPEDKIRISRVPLYLNREELQLIEQVKKKNHEYITDALNKVRFLYIGRLDREKRVDHIIKMFYRFLKMSKEKCLAVELIIFGEGPLKELIMKMVKNFGIQGYVKILGAVAGEKKWLHYLTSTALVLASESEGLPRVIFEAFATGKVVIVPNICGLNEVVHNGVNGFLFKDDKEFLEILGLVVKDRQSILAMGDNNYRLVIEKFTLDEKKEDTCSPLKEICKLNTGGVEAKNNERVLREISELLEGV